MLGASAVSLAFVFHGLLKTKYKETQPAEPPALFRKTAMLSLFVFSNFRQCPGY